MTVERVGIGRVEEEQTMDFEIKDDPEKKKFYIPLTEGEAYIEYEKRDDRTIEYISTFVSPDQRGTPYGRELVKYALKYARIHNLKIIPTCPYVRKILLREKSEYKDLAITYSENVAANR